MSPMEINEKKVVVVGLAKTGRAAARFLREQGAVVTVTDTRSSDDLSAEIREMESLGVTVAAGGHPPQVWEGAELAVTSPGVAWDAPVLVEARERNIEVISELELAFRYIKGVVLAVTGTNGKSTTTALLAHLLERCGLRVTVGGNLGTPLIELLAEDSVETHHVVECSSFQLEGTTTFRPHVAVLLNLTPDHLDRHGDFDTYLEAKAKIFAQQTDADFAVLNADDPEVLRSAIGARARVVPFRREGTASGGLWVEGQHVRNGMMGKADAWLDVSTLPLRGPHNVENTMAACAAALAIGCPLDRIGPALEGFQPLPHRLEPLGSVKGVLFVNDSKATNVESVVRAVESFSGGVHLILGGRDKGGDWDKLRVPAAGRVRQLLLIGESAGVIAQTLDGAAPMEMAADIQEAVRVAMSRSSAGDVILLSPGCASFDMFRSFEHRGDSFREAFGALQEDQHAQAG